MHVAATFIHTRGDGRKTKQSEHPPSFFFFCFFFFRVVGKKKKKKRKKRRGKSVEKNKTSETLYPHTSRSFRRPPHYEEKAE